MKQHFFQPSGMPLVCYLAVLAGALLALAMLVPATEFAAAADPPASAKKGDMVFATDFSGDAPLQGWSAGGVIAKTPDGNPHLMISSAAGTPGTIVSIPLPVEPYRGCMLYVSGRVKATNVSERPNAWNGVKLMAPVEAPAGKQWPQAPLGVGSYDWQNASFAVRVPNDATKLELVLGLELVAGEARFDDVRVTVGRLPVAVPPPADPSKPIYTGHDAGRLRGAMVHPDVTPDSLRVLGRDWGANLIRYQIIRSGDFPKPFDPQQYAAWLDTQLAKLDLLLPVCREVGLKVVVDLHSPPGGEGIAGGYAAANAGFFTNPAAQQAFVDTWTTLAKRYRGEATIWGFDLANEPVDEVVAEGCDDWQALAEKAAAAVHAADPARTIIIEPAAWGGPQGFAAFAPIGVPNVVYSFHYYTPGEFSHQGVFSPSEPITYPGLIAGKTWNRDTMVAEMKPAIDFARRYRVHMYVGEFSAIRWAPGDSAEAFLRDAIDVFESQGWDWTYHAFREWHGWSVEHGGDKNDTNPSPTPTPRQKLLTGWFAKDRVPAAGTPSR